eukprot:scaffold35629_cov21-Tisochrysis_lutea.AAC.1
MLAAQFLQTHKDLLLPTDLVLSADGRQTAENEGGIVLAMRKRSLSKRFGISSSIVGAVNLAGA